MPQEKKNRKMRGKVAHGYGRTNKHRKHPSGRGNCGGLKYMRTWFERYHPDHFGKHGERLYHVKKNARWTRTIPAAKLWSLVPEEQRNVILKSDSVPVIDARAFGYHIVIGANLPVERPIIVKARHFSRNAREEITRVGGKFIVCD